MEGAASLCVYVCVFGLGGLVAQLCQVRINQAVCGLLEESLWAILGGWWDFHWELTIALLGKPSAVAREHRAWGVLGGFQ